MLQKFRFTLVAILVPVSLSAVLYPVRHPDKTYGLKIITLGDMCTEAFTLNEGLGRFTVTDTFVKYYWERHPAIPDAPIKDEKLPISLAKGLVKAALMYPDIVDAKIDTTYEEAKKMFEAKTPITTIRNYVLDRLRKIAKLTEGR